MNKVIIFDLDGVLIDSKEIHFVALNNALKNVGDQYVISEEEHHKFYEGLTTKDKLKLLTKNKGLDKKYYDIIWKNKQQETQILFNTIKKDNELIKKIKYIKSFEINVAVASNSIKKTITQSLDLLGVSDLVDYVISNEDVIFAKPHPEMYWKTISYFGALIEDVVIFEDSFIGTLAANNSKAKLIHIKNRKDLSDEKIEEAILYLKNTNRVWNNKNLNILIPMAGMGSRFSNTGNLTPKPLIDVNGIPMIQAVVNNLSINANYIYVVQQEHYNKYNLEYLLNAITPNCNIIKIDGLTDGAARTCLMAEYHINNENPLLIVNSDQILKWSSSDFFYDLYTKNADGGIVTFKASDPKWSYAKTNNNSLVLEVAEKNPISNDATAGIYYWKYGKDFIKYAKQMIKNNIRTNEEFYVCPVFNEAIKDNKSIYTFLVENMWGIGTPEDLSFYLANVVDNA
jgi:beta-phosphoglucomutase-like phosphatase (HAD superfamily)/dTDP-glucose pyrophosphorylase